MKRIFLMSALALATAGAMACDVCGCGSGGQYIGLLPMAHWNFIGVQHQYSAFSGSFPSIGQGRPDEQVYDRYNTFRLWARYNIGSKYQAFAFVPYQYNTRDKDGIRSTSSGIGDVSAMVNRVIVNDDTHEWMHTWYAGAAIKAPTGAFNNITTIESRTLPNVQPGTGSWDVTALTNYTIRHGRWGANADVTYTLTTANKYQYKYGDRLGTGAVGFYTTQLKGVNILPQLGARYEYALHDYDNYQRKWLNEESGGYICYAIAGAQAYYKRIGMRLTYQLPFSQDYSAGQVVAKQKLETSIFFLF